MNDIIYCNKLLRDMCDERLKALYGDDIPTECAQRVEEELKIIEENSAAPTLLLFINAINKAEPKKRTLSGMRTHSYIQYLLGIDLINPLNRELMDGHIIEIEHLSGFGKMFMDNYFYTTQDMVGKVGAAFEADESVDNVFVNYLSRYETSAKSKTIYGITFKTGFTYPKFPQKFKYPKKFMEFAAIIDKQLEFIDMLAYTTNTNPLTVPYTDKAVINLAADSKGNTLGNKGLHIISEDKSMFSLLAAVKPETFYQLSKFIALYLGKGTLENDKLNKLYNGDIDINTILSTKDDVFELFVNKTGDRESAYYSSLELNSEKSAYSYTKYDPKQYDCEEIKGIKYLPTRHESLIRARIACTQAYYKLHYPEEFYYAYFTCFAPWAFKGESIGPYNMFSEGNPQEAMLHIATLKEMYKNGFDLAAIAQKMAEKIENAIVVNGRVRIEP